MAHISFEEVKEILKKSIDETTNINEALEKTVQFIYLKGYEDGSRRLWIPCSETVDIPDHEVLACDKRGEEILGYLEYADEQWICASEDCVMYNPIAWMEKPEPYQGEGNQDE